MSADTSHTNSSGSAAAKTTTSSRGAPTSPPAADPPSTAARASDKIRIGLDTPAAAAAAPAAEERDALDGIRRTAEYKAAWDLELWKGIQADQFVKQLEKQKTRASQDLHRVMQTKAREQQSTMTQRATALDLREEKVRLGEVQLLQKQQRVAEMEKDLRRTRQQLLEAQRRVEEEVRAQVRRANEDIAHKSRILQERVLAAEAQTKKAEERQRQSHNEYLQLYESFNRFRTEQLTATADGPAGRILLDAQAQIQQLRTQYMEEQRLAVERAEQKHYTQVAELTARCKELEEQNRRLTSALARRREQLEQFRHLEAEGKRARQQGPAAREAVPTAAPVAPRQQLPLPIAELSDELGRLRKERITLVEGSAGALSATDDVVLRLDRRIKEMEGQLGDYVSRALSGSAVML